ncbi:MAG: ribokinase [Bacteroidaceae bacterium]|nr:ribokinase [Bacteroidaceae bacterium]MBQ9645693.1 ribokinase [Prevotella sp.]
MEKKQILCIGHITHDRIITPATPEGVDCAGGTAYYVAWAMNHMPHDISFGVITAVGDDLKHEIDKLRLAGVDIADLGSPTSVYFENSYGRNMNNRRQRVMSKAAPFTVEQLKNAEAEVFHLGTLLVDDFSPEVVEYLAGKGRVCIDVQGYLREVRNHRVYAVDWNDKLRVLKHTDILKVNEHEIDVLTDGERDLHRAARMIAGWGVREVLVTLGNYGSLIYADDRFYEIPSYPPRQTIDATGCGDTYAAGYLYARSRGASCDEAGRLAAAMCTLKLEHTGPFDSTIEEARKIISQE